MFARPINRRSARPVNKPGPVDLSTGGQLDPRVITGDRLDIPTRRSARPKNRRSARPITRRSARHTNRRCPLKQCGGDRNGTPRAHTLSAQHQSTDVPLYMSGHVRTVCMLMKKSPTNILCMSESIGITHQPSTALIRPPFASCYTHGVDNYRGQNLCSGVEHCRGVSAPTGLTTRGGLALPHHYIGFTPHAAGSAYNGGARDGGHVTCPVDNTHGG